MFRLVNRRKGIFWVFLFLHIVCCDVQGQPSLPVVSQAPPNQASFFAYKQIPVSYYTGIPAISIPLGVMKGIDKELDISLSYHSSGIKVEDEASSVGLGWALNSGGVITRNLSSDAGGNLPCSTITNSTASYSYRFENYGGTFYLNNSTGKGMIVKQEDLDITSLASDAGFTIRTVDGFIYQFTTVETASLSSAKSWYLTSIASPNGNVINYEYETASDYDYKTLRTNNELLTNISTSAGVYVGVPGSAGDPSNWTFDDANCRNYYAGGVGPDDYPATMDLISNIRTLYIKKISSDLGVVEFEYEDRTDLNHPGTTMPKRVKCMLVYSKRDATQDLIKKYLFDYDYSDYNNLNTVESKRLRLRGLRIANPNGSILPVCTIQYNNNVLPSKTSVNQDHWGYYNGPINNPSIHPAQGANREPDELYTGAGMIESITYPTGGKTKFEFESNDYSNRGSTGFKKGGGMRIKRIIADDASGTAPMKKRFEYTNIVNGNTVSSGKLVYSLNYSVFRSCHFEHLCPGQYKTYNTSCNCYQTHNFTAIAEIYISYTSNYAHPTQLTTLDYGPPVCYDKVTEYDEGASNTGKTVYEYVNQEAGAWGPQANVSSTSGPADIAIPDNGTLLKKTTYSYNINDNSYYSLFSEENEYEVVNKKQLGFYKQKSNYIGLSHTSTPNCINSNLVVATFNTGWTRLKKQTIKNYTLNNSTVTPVTVAKLYSYKYTNDPLNFLVSKIEANNSMGQTLSEEFVYPDSYATTEPYVTMISKGLLSPVIEQIRKTNGNVTWKQINTYKKDWFSDQHIIAVSSVDEQLGSNSLERVYTVNNYDTKGNLVSFLPRSGINTVRLMGYNNSYPVALVTGTDYATAVSFVNQSVLQSPSGDQQLRDEINKIRTGLFSSPAEVISYTHSRLIGVNSITDANNKTTYYDYDGFGRLALVRDQDKNVLKKICYNYFGQPIDCVSPCVNTTPNWQNTLTPPRCQQTSPCVYTGYQEQEQKDMNPCSPTYNHLQWVMAGYNPLSCPAGTNVQMAYQNSYYPGFTATYTNALTGAVFTFPVPAAGSGFLGCLPAGTYYVNIAKPGNTTVFLFGLGCRSISGTSGGTKITVSATACNQVSISLVNGE